MIKSKKEILLTNIQRFSLHDGPGIRTTIFLKGCSLRCPWCSNPENLLPQKQKYKKNGIIGTYGYWLSPDELVQECLKDRSFYNGILDDPSLWGITEASMIEQLPGGVTFSGGEPLLQIDALTPVIEHLHNEKVHIAIETSLFVKPEKLISALAMVDFYYVDIKILDEEKCRSVERGDLNLFYNNFDALMQWKDNNQNYRPVVVRIPVIGSYTDDRDQRSFVKRFIGKHKDRILKIELIQEHKLGEAKYRSLNLKSEYHGVQNHIMKLYKEELDDLNILTEICRI